MNNSKSESTWASWNKSANTWQAPNIYGERTEAGSSNTRSPASGSDSSKTITPKTNPANKWGSGACTCAECEDLSAEPVRWGEKDAAVDEGVAENDCDHGCAYPGSENEGPDESKAETGDDENTEDKSSDVYEGVWSCMNCGVPEGWHRLDIPVSESSRPRPSENTKGKTTRCPAQSESETSYKPRSRAGSFLFGPPPSVKSTNLEDQAYLSGLGRTPFGIGAGLNTGRYNIFGEQIPGQGRRPFGISGLNYPYDPTGRYTILGDRYRRPSIDSANSYGLYVRTHPYNQVPGYVPYQDPCMSQQHNRYNSPLNTGTLDDYSPYFFPFDNYPSYYPENYMPASPMPIGSMPPPLTEAQATAYYNEELEAYLQANRHWHPPNPFGPGGISPYPYCGTTDKYGTKTCSTCLSAFLNFRRQLLKEQHDDFKNLSFSDYLKKYVPELARAWPDYGDEAARAGDKDEWLLTGEEEEYTEKYFGNGGKVAKKDKEEENEQEDDDTSVEPANDEASERKTSRSVSFADINESAIDEDDRVFHSDSETSSVKALERESEASECDEEDDHSEASQTSAIHSDTDSKHDQDIENLSQEGDTSAKPDEKSVQAKMLQVVSDIAAVKPSIYYDLAKLLNNFIDHELAKASAAGSSSPRLSKQPSKSASSPSARKFSPSPSPSPPRTRSPSPPPRRSALPFGIHPFRAKARALIPGFRLDYNGMPTRLIPY